MALLITPADLMASRGNKPRTGAVKSCAQCGASFYVQPSNLARQFCSAACRHESMRKPPPQTCLECGKEFRVSPSMKRLRNIERCSKACWAKALSKRQRGAANSQWKGGIASGERRPRACAEASAWRKAVFARDNWTCQACGARSRKGSPVKLNADHIKPFATHPELRWDLSNGRTLCVECHKKTDTWGNTKKKKETPVIINPKGQAGWAFVAVCSP